MISIDVIIPAKNEESHLGKCLKSITRCHHPSIKKIIVVDNASEDSTAEIARQFPNISIIFDSVRGNAHAKQYGLQFSQSEFVAIIDADVELPPHWFSLASDYIAKDPRLVCVSGPCIYYDMPLWQRCILHLYHVCIALPTSKCIGVYLTGGICLIRRNALEQAGGFDIERCLGGEDVNLARRLHSTGKLLWSLRLFAHASDRRFRQHGFFQTCKYYFIAYWGQILFSRYCVRSPADADPPLIFETSGGI